MLTVVVAAAAATALGACSRAPAAKADPPVPPSAGHVWKQTFTDDFDALQLDHAKWTTCYWWVVANGCTNAGNGELEWYRPNGVFVQNGVAHLRATRQFVMGADRKPYGYTSGMITTGRTSSVLSTPPRYQFTYGYAEMRAQIPSGRGLWPAFWLLSSDQKWPPEIDAVEFRGDQTTTAYQGLHYVDPNGQAAAYANTADGPDYSAGFHTFGVDWEPNSITWYVDGVQTYQVTDVAAIPHAPMYLLANLAVGGALPGSPDSTTQLPADMQIDFIRVWQQATPRPAARRVCRTRRSHGHHRRVCRTVRNR